MSKNIMDINRIRDLHRHGKLEEAKQGYLVILRKNPRHVEALHSVGVILAQQKNFSKAIDYLKKAIQYEPTEPTFQLHLANVLKMQGLYNQACEVLKKTIELHPEYVPAFNNLGTVYYAKGCIDDAIRFYRIAIAKEPNYADAYYNLSIALLKRNEAAEAIQLLQKLLEHVPDHFAAHFHIACAYMQQEQFDHAIQTFLVIETSHPHHVETQTNLATCYLKKGSFDKAKIHYLKAIELDPRDTQSLFNLGYINMQQGNLDAAIQYYQRTVNLAHDSFAAHNNLAVAFLAKPQLSLALHHFKEAQRLQPNNQSIAYNIHALEQNQPLLSAPPDYVQSLFDAYADHYESHLLHALDYHVPALLEKALSKFISKSQSLDVLDLGCGTGLCGTTIKPYAKSLIGVDLSSKMLEIAAQKHIYNELFTNDLTLFLTNTLTHYDLIIAGDVLVYLGDLTTLFKLVRKSLRQKGLFVFNTEVSQNLPFKMNQSGRFSHHKNYIESEAEKNHFKISFYQSAITRKQNNDPVYGHIYILQAT